MHETNDIAQRAFTKRRKERRVTEERTMAEGSSSSHGPTPVTRPQHEAEESPSPSIGNESSSSRHHYRTTANSTENNAKNTGSDTKRYGGSAHDFRTPSHRGRRSARDPNNNHRQYLPNQSVMDSPFLSPPGTIRKRQSMPETAAIRQPNTNHRPTRLNGSSFLSPPMQSSSSGDPSYGSRKTRPEPLVLDPSASNRKSLSSGQYGGAYYSEHRRVSMSTSSSSASLGANATGVSLVDGTNHDNNSSGGTVQKLLQVATQGIREHHAAAAQYSTGSSVHATPTAGSGHGSYSGTAANFARSSGVVRAGFLQKLGKNIPEMKRRFFVLKPETNLYYYLSPNDTEPRGRIDLEGSSIEELDTTADGRLRFAVSLRDDEEDATRGRHNDGDHRNQQQQKIVLEARSTEIGEEWIHHMKGERVSFLKDQVETLKSTKAEQAVRIADLERQVEHFRMIEADRDGALEDAKNWKDKFHKLDEGLRLLTQQIRKSLATPISTTERSANTGDKNSNDTAVDKQQTLDDDTSKSDPHRVSDYATVSHENDDGQTEFEPSSTSGTDEGESTANTAAIKIPSKNDTSPALLDDLVQEDMDVEEIIDVPGTYFSGLSNAFQQQKEASRLASIEASTAVEDLLEANERVDAIQKRMKKAEKQILKLWEENCTIRKTLKQKKREKRVLVREVKQLQQTVSDLREDHHQLSQSILVSNTSRVAEDDGPMADTMIGSDEERLIIELEEHVASSIRLHERLVASTDFDRDMEQSISTNPASVQYDTIFERGHIETSKPKLLSLLDDDDDTDSDEEDASKQGDLKGSDSRTDLRSLMGSIASTADNTAMSDVDNTLHIDNTGRLLTISTGDDDTSSPHRINPLLKLDNDDDNEVLKEQRLNPHWTKPLSSKHITENGQATSRLVCPLADVVDTRGNSSATDANGNPIQYEPNQDLKIHHLTFHSRKIGLQFQKASPAPSKPRGLLTDALTADLAEDADGSGKTAAELRSVASIASLAKGGTNAHGQEVACPLALPEDIVLVCGFEGFDDSGANQRPKLGARLVAFDGVSVEVGKWTFETISKAIKSRGRPLTLSFRNDFLTTEQRAILTKAVKDVDAKRDPVQIRPIASQYERPPSTTPSLNSAFSHESAQFLNNELTHGAHLSNVSSHQSVGLDRNRNTIEERKYWNQIPSSGSSISSYYSESHHTGMGPPQLIPSSSSASTHVSRNSILSTANMNHFNATGGRHIPAPSSERQERSNNIFRRNSNSNHETTGGSERTRRFKTGINPSGTPQHQDFQSNLL